jgi:NADH-quinone oxidoreductase subunit A
VSEMILATTLFWPFMVYAACAVAVVAGMLVVSYILGERRRSAERDLPYEGGVASTGSARLRLSAKFYLVAMFFVIFDLESVFLFVWAVAVRQVGWAGYVEVLIFIGVLLAALTYLWRTGALEWRELRKSEPLAGEDQ